MSDRGDAIIAVLATVGMCILIGAAVAEVSSTSAEHQLREELVEKGHAEWFLNEDNDKDWRLLSVEEIVERHSQGEE